MSAPVMPAPAFQNSLRIAAIFFFASAVYIIASDFLLEELVASEASMATGMLKGLVYVSLAATLLFAVVYRRERQNEEYVSLLMERTHALVAMEKRQQAALLASTVIHDIRNAVGAMHLNIKALRKEPHTTEDSREIAEDLDELSERLMDLTQRLRPASRKFQKLFHAPARTDEFVQVFKRSVRNMNPVHFTGTRQPVTLYGDETLFERMLGNILQNAVEASPEGKPIEVTTTSEGDNFVLNIQDHGSGIAPSEQEKIWDPLFTTKDYGTGLGLSVVREAVDTFGGTLTLTSSPDSGTCFQIMLPAAKEQTSQ